MLNGISLFLCQGDNFDLDSRIPRQSSGCHCSSCRRRFTKESTVDLVHSRKVLHVCEKNCRLHNLIQTAAARFQYSRNVLQDLFSLFANAALNKFTSGRINRNLSRRKNKPVRLDRLRIWADRGGRVGSLYSEL